MEKEKGQNQTALTQNDKPNGSTPTSPLVTGQRAKILSLLRQGPTLSLTLKLELAITESAARIHELRAMGFNIPPAQMLKPVIFKEKTFQRAALYSLGNPEWPRPGFLLDNDLPPAA